MPDTNQVTACVSIRKLILSDAELTKLLRTADVIAEGVLAEEDSIFGTQVREDYLLLCEGGLV